MSETRPGHGWLSSGGAVTLLAALALLHLWLAAHAGPGGFLSDDAVYLLMAEWFAGSREPAVEFLASRSHLPPGFPLALALSGASGERPLPGHLLNAALFAAVLVVSWLHHRRRQPSALALAGCVVLAFAPASLLHSLTLWSEPLYTLLSLLCLTMLDHDGIDSRRWLLIAMLAGVALVVRSAAVALLAAAIVQMLRHRPPRAWVYALPVLAPLAAWWLLRPAEQLDSGYTGLLARNLLADEGSGVLRVLAGNAATLPSSWAGIFDLLHSDTALAAASLVAVLAVLGWITRLLACRADAIYVLAYMAMLLLWPATTDVQQRLLLPVLPLALGYASDTGLWLARASRRVGRPTRVIVAGIPAALVMVAMLPSLTLAANRLVEPLPAELEPMRYSPWWLRNPDGAVARADLQMRTMAMKAARDLRRFLASDECLYARPIQFYLLYSRRRAFSPPPPGAQDWPVCGYVYAAGSLDNVVRLDGVLPGSTLVHGVALPDDPDHVVGLLFKLPGPSSDNPEHAND